MIRLEGVEAVAEVTEARNDVAAQSVSHASK